MAPKPGEHPLMSNRTLRAMYAGLASSQTMLASGKRQPGSIPRKASLAEIACWVAPFVSLAPADIVFSCRQDSLLPHLRPKSPPSAYIPDGTARLYAAIGAATLAAHLPKHAVVLAFFERHETEKRAWTKALAFAAELPLLLIVLPRWKGRDTPTDLRKLARAANIPAIPVDAQDPIALYRVAQESLIRARAAGGAALLEAVSIPNAEPAEPKLAAYLLQRGIASQAWIKSHTGLPVKNQ